MVDIVLDGEVDGGVVVEALYGFLCGNGDVSSGSADVGVPDG